MAAELIPSLDGEQPHCLKLPPRNVAGDPVEEVRNALILEPSLQGPVDLHCGAWPLRVGDYRRLRELLEPTSLSLRRVCCLEEGAWVAAASMGWAVERLAMRETAPPGAEAPQSAGGLAIHQGTLRSGDHQQAAGSLLVLGDVNPGAQISAAGHVMVWGRLRGIAHAGCSGDRTACIVALQLQPLQLRIADLVARGPSEAPPTGLAEKAHLVNGTIQIDPADPIWPLGGVPAQGLGHP
ncbi:MAG: septum site-determining protein MinC [Cyanobacteriota bacterium]|nr:septum site-determining protein MinC [Cyanobacteriota bacterium]